MVSPGSHRAGLRDRSGAETGAQHERSATNEPDGCRPLLPGAAGQLCAERGSGRPAGRVERIDACPRATTHTRADRRRLGRRSAVRRSDRGLGHRRAAGGRQRWRRAVVVPAGHSQGPGHRPATLVGVRLRRGQRLGGAGLGPVGGPDQRRHPLGRTVLQSRVRERDLRDRRRHVDPQRARGDVGAASRRRPSGLHPPGGDRVSADHPSPGPGRRWRRRHRRLLLGGA
jgi:hypothetical protein